MDVVVGVDVRVRVGIGIYYGCSRACARARASVYLCNDKRNTYVSPPK